MKHFDYEINLLADGELEELEAKHLFLHLSDCEECRKVFFETLLVKENSKKFISDEISGLMNKSKQKLNFYKITSLTAVAASIVLFFLLISSKPGKIFQPIKVGRIDTVYIQDTQNGHQLVTKRKGLNTASNERLPELSTQKEYLRYVMNLRSVEFNNNENSNRKRNNL